MCRSSYAECWNVRLLADLCDSEKLLIAKRYIALFLKAYCFHTWSFDLFLKIFHCPPTMEKFFSVTPSKLETDTVAVLLPTCPAGGMTSQGFVSWRPAIFPPRGDWEVLADPLVPPAHGRAGCVRRCQMLGSVTRSCLSWWSSYWAADVLSAWKDGDLASVIPFSTVIGG